MTQPGSGSGAGVRAQLRTALAAFWTVVTVMVLAFDVDIPNREEVLAAWGGLFFAATGLAEAWYDSRRPPRP